MTAEPTGQVMRSPDPIKQRERYELVGDSGGELILKAPFEIRLPIGDIT